MQERNNPTPKIPNGRIKNSIRTFSLLTGFFLVIKLDFPKISWIFFLSNPALEKNYQSSSHAQILTEAKS